MMLYIGSDSSLPIIPFRDEAPAFHTETLGENDAKVIKYFSFKYVLYAGSSKGCGCGFQHALIDQGTNWLNVMDEEENEFRVNMQQLYEYVKDVFDNRGRVELYVCWTETLKMLHY